MSERRQKASIDAQGCLVLLIAGVLITSVIATVSLDIPEKSTVVDKKGKSVYVDIDGDGLADKKERISQYGNAVCEYIQPGDTLKCDGGCLRYVNNRSLKDIRRLYKENKIRAQIGQQKQR